MADDNYPIIKKRKRDKFPLGETNRRAQVHTNDPKLPENNRRLRIVDPLKDGWDDGEDPIKDEKPRPDVKIPIR